MGDHYRSSGALHRSVLLLVVLLVITACSTVQHSQPVTKNPDDPLIGEIYRVDGVAQINRTDLLQTMSESDVIYMGENHDNIYHHETQLEIIKELVGKGLRPAIGFEFFSRHQTSHLIRHQNSSNDYHGNHSKNAAETLLRLQLGWGENRNQDWRHLYPILQYARSYKLPVFGADISSGMRKQLSRVGYSGLSPVEKLLIPESDFSDDVYREFMYQSFIRSHCGWEDKSYLARLYDAWLSRNESMAQSIVATHKEFPDQPVVMILGGGHTQYNMAVYERVAHLDPSIRQINFRFLEVAAERIEPGDYFQPLKIDSKDYGLPYEYVWYTPRAPERPNPCASFRQHKKK